MLKVAQHTGGANDAPTGRTANTRAAAPARGLHVSEVSDAAALADIPFVVERYVGLFVSSFAYFCDKRVLGAARLQPFAASHSLMIVNVLSRCIPRDIT